MEIVGAEQQQQLPPGRKLRQTEEGRKNIHHDESKAATGEGMECSTFFWISAGVGWIVWVFSVSAAADQNWMERKGEEYGAGSDDFKEACEAYAFVANSICMAYDFFSASQILSTVLCSVAVIMYTMAFFRPAEAPHGSAQVLGLVGGILMTVAAFFQMLAFLFADMAVEEFNEILEVELDDTTSDTTDEWKMSLGPTYGVGIFTFILSATNAVAVFVSYRQAGDGPVLLIAKGV